MSSPACENAWRFLAKWFCVSGFAWTMNAAPSSSFVHAAIVDNAIAASPAALGRDAVNGAAPIAGTSKVRKDNSIIATASGNTANAGRKLA